MLAICGGNVQQRKRSRSGSSTTRGNHQRSGRDRVRPRKLLAYGGENSLALSCVGGNNSSCNSEMESLFNFTQNNTPPLALEKQLQLDPQQTCNNSKTSMSAFDECDSRAHLCYHHQHSSSNVRSPLGQPPVFSMPNSIHFCDTCSLSEPSSYSNASSHSCSTCHSTTAPSTESTTASRLSYCSSDGCDDCYRFSNKSTTAGFNQRSRPTQSLPARSDALCPVIQDPFLLLRWQCRQRWYQHDGCSILNKRFSLMVWVLIVPILLLVLLPTTDACSTRPSPKPRPPYVDWVTSGVNATQRGNGSSKGGGGANAEIKNCTDDYSELYCHNGGTCQLISVQGIGERKVCLCPTGSYGHKCSLVNNRFQHSRQQKAKTASVAAAVIFVVLGCFIVGILLHIRQIRNKYPRSVHDVDGPEVGLPDRPFSIRKNIQIDDMLAASNFGRFHPKTGSNDAFHSGLDNHYRIQQVPIASSEESCSSGSFISSSRQNTPERTLESLDPRFSGIPSLMTRSMVDQVDGIDMPNSEHF